MKPELSQHASSDSGLNCYKSSRLYSKHVLPLTTAIFFAISPSPDSRDIAELTANFIAPVKLSGISAFKTDG